MSNTANRLKRKSRTEKVKEGAIPTHKTKFEETSQSIPKFEAKTQNQKLALAYLREGRQVVNLQGAAGAGKSMIAAYWAATQLKNKKIDSVILIRPNVHNGKSLGSVPGTEAEKLASFFIQTMSHLENFLGGAMFKYCIDKSIITTRAFEYCRGQSWENCIVIAEEVQGLTSDEFETLLTRVGEGCQLITTGDTRQINKGFTSGMDSTFKMIEDAVENQPNYLDDADLDVLEDAVGIVHFTTADILRSGFCRAMVKLYYNKQ